MVKLKAGNRLFDAALAKLSPRKSVHFYLFDFSHLQAKSPHAKYSLTTLPKKRIILRKFSLVLQKPQVSTHFNETAETRQHTLCLQQLLRLKWLAERSETLRLRDLSAGNCPPNANFWSASVPTEAFLFPQGYPHLTISSRNSQSSINPSSVLI